MQMFKEKNVVITGANRGIGKETLELFAKEGARIFAVVRNINEDFTCFCNNLSKEYETEIIPIEMELGDEESIVSGYRQIVKIEKRIDVLINNAGVAREQSSLAMTKMDDIKNVFQVNFFSQVLLIQLFSRNMMRQKSGSIVCLSSSAAFDGGGNVEYSASKAAIIGMVRRLSKELGVYNIRINAIAPGLTQTDMADTLSEDDKAVAKNMCAMHRLGQKNEIANTIAFVSSDNASFITGQVIRVDGGL